mgnify:CR=1 FL=1
MKNSYYIRNIEKAREYNRERYRKSHSRKQKTAYLLKNESEEIVISTLKELMDFLGFSERYTLRRIQLGKPLKGYLVTRLYEEKYLYQGK